MQCHTDWHHSPPCHLNPKQLPCSLGATSLSLPTKQVFAHLQGERGSKKSTNAGGWGLSSHSRTLQARVTKTWGKVMPLGSQPENRYEWHHNINCSNWGFGCCEKWVHAEVSDRAVEEQQPTPECETQQETHVQLHLLLSLAALWSGVELSKPF